jgi:hypothetical protein
VKVRGPNTSVSKVPLLSVSAKTRMVALVESTSVICTVQLLFGHPLLERLALSGWGYGLPG